MDRRPQIEPGRIPGAVRRLAERLCCDESAGFTHVRLLQNGRMRRDGASGWMKFKARQHIETNRCAFRWIAETGPFGAVRIKDAFNGERGALNVSLFGVAPIVRARRTHELACGELMRYLAELAWAPDAILSNTSLLWTARDERRFTLSAKTGHAFAEVEITLGKDGLVEQVFAADRPREVGGAFVRQPWRGVFSDYRHCGGRLIPTHAEVAWINDGDVESVWIGDIVDWRLI